MELLWARKGCGLKDLNQYSFLILYSFHSIIRSKVKMRNVCNLYCKSSSQEKFDRTSMHLLMRVSKYLHIKLCINKAQQASIPRQCVEPQRKRVREREYFCIFFPKGRPFQWRHVVYKSVKAIIKSSFISNVKLYRIALCTSIFACRATKYLHAFIFRMKCESMSPTSTRERLERFYFIFFLLSLKTQANDFSKYIKINII